MDYHYEQQARQRGYEAICGVDEAGRGPLAGDVYAAAVILPDGVVIDGLNDSKKLSPAKREKLYIEITEKTVWSVATASVEEIDRLNILNASLLAMSRAVAGLVLSPDYAVIDGNRAPTLSCRTETLVKGDALCPSVAAASILAKVARDRYMAQMALIYPDYAFSQHKGYGTQQHIALLREYGPCPIHRKTFIKHFIPALGDEKR